MPCGPGGARKGAHRIPITLAEVLCIRLELGFQVAMRRGARSPGMGMPLDCFDTHEVQGAVPDPGGCGQLRSKLAHRGGGPLQHHGLQAVVVIEVDMHRGHSQVVMGMLRGGNSLGERALVVVINIGEAGNAMTLRSRGMARVIEAIADEIAYRLAAIAVTVLFDEAIKGACQFVINGNRDALHGVTTSAWSLQEFDEITVRISRMKHFACQSSPLRIRFL